jgi:SAM-dependent methyltransferase
VLTTEEQNTLDSYNKIAVDWSATLDADYWQKEYKKFSSLLPKGHIIDIGSGPGRDSLWFTKHGYDCTGVDVSEEMVRLAQTANPKAKFFLKNLYELNFPPATFDGFWAACCLLHIPKAKINLALLSIKSVLKPGAIGFISIKEGIGEVMVEWKNSGHKRLFAYYSLEEFKNILEIAGFKILESFKKLPSNANQDGTFLIYYIKV